MSGRCIYRDECWECAGHCENYKPDMSERWAIEDAERKEKERNEAPIPPKGYKHIIGERVKKGDLYYNYKEEKWEEFFEGSYGWLVTYYMARKT